MTEADTLEDVYEMIEDAKRSWLEAAIEDGSEIPLPESMEEGRYSGRILIRIPKSLHRKLVESARDEGMSVNTYIVSLLSERNATRGVLRKVLKELQSVKGNVAFTLGAEPESSLGYTNLNYKTRFRISPKYRIV